MLGATAIYKSRKSLAHLFFHLNPLEGHFPMGIAYIAVGNPIPVSSLTVSMDHSDTQVAELNAL